MIENCDHTFNVFGGAWTGATPDHMSQLPRKGDTVVGNDVWLGRECVVMPGVKIGDGAIVAAYSVVTRDVAPYTVAGGNPARFIKNRFVEELTGLLLRLKWWDLPPEELVAWLPILCDENLENLRSALKSRLDWPRSGTFEPPTWGNAPNSAHFPTFFEKPIPCFPRLDI